MENKFDWYFHPSTQEIDEIWKNGILTVDANVLLDLYRYHENTRNSLLESINKFEGKKWLSYQAAREFFRNRNKVIISSEKTFKEAEGEIEKLRNSLDSTVNQLKGNRIIPSEVPEELDKDVRVAISEAQTKIKEARENYPKFIQDDPILNQLAAIFKGAVGDDFKDEDQEKIKEQAEQRKKDKVPPGFLDDEKEEDRPYGDYFLWLQIIEHAKAEKLPIVLVTSERKEDWWEKISGKTTGPRPELLKEATQYSGQRILIYQTERFLEYALQRFHEPVNKTAIEEILALGTLRAEFESAVKLIEQDIDENTIYRNAGTLTLEIRRSVRNFTVSGHLAPKMYDIPSLNVRLISTPEPFPKYKLTTGTGTTYDFNIHVICREWGVSLPIGSYVFEYEAACSDTPNDSDATPSAEI